MTVILCPIATGYTQELEGSLGWNPHGIIGDVIYAPVRLDGYDIFSIAAERQKEKGDQWGVSSLQIRRFLIESRLRVQVRSQPLGQLHESVSSRLTVGGFGKRKAFTGRLRRGFLYFKANLISIISLLHG